MKPIVYICTCTSVLSPTDHIQAYKSLWMTSFSIGNVNSCAQWYVPVSVLDVRTDGTTHLNAGK